MTQTPQTVAPGVMSVFNEGAPTSGTNEQQTLTKTGSPTSGGIYVGYTGETDQVFLPFDMDAAAILAAINSLPYTGPSGVSVAGTGPWTLTFSGGNVGGKNVPQLEVKSSTLDTGSFVFATTVPGVLGTFGGKCPKGATLQDSTNGKLYVNTGTQLTPTWTVAGTQS